MGQNWVGHHGHVFHARARDRGKWWGGQEKVLNQVFGPVFQVSEDPSTHCQIVAVVPMGSVQRQGSVWAIKDFVGVVHTPYHFFDLPPALEPCITQGILVE